MRVVVILIFEASKIGVYTIKQKANAKKKPGPDFSGPGFSPMKHKTSEPLGMESWGDFGYVERQKGLCSRL